MTNPYWSPTIRELAPYVPGEQPRLPDIVKLNTNENPYPPSPQVLAAVRAAADDNLRLYPPPEADELKAAIAAYHGVAADQVFVGNGSDEVLAHAFLGLLDHGRPVWFPDITYSFYPVYCRLYGIPWSEVPLTADYAIDLADYCGDGNGGTGGIVIANPNAPTGRALPRADIAALAAANRDAVVLVDEAYVDFGAESAVPLIADHPNLLVVQTLSKSRALAGLRLGFAIGDAGLIQALDRVKNSFNSYPLDRLAIAGGIAAFADEAWFQAQRQRIIASREALVGALAGLGFEVLPSAANFVFARHPRCGGRELYEGLRRRAVLVRHFEKPRIAQFLRITVGTEAQHQRLLAALGELLS
ncbi:MAG: histidinol-phosphate transaminase [Pseudomonadales bacterium]|nr:histidinol-phosphate transaminase [Pseudomonadales bacterium]